MKAKGLLVEAEYKVNEETQKRSMTLKVLFQNPAQLVTVNVNQSKLDAGYGVMLEQHLEETFEFTLSFDEFKFADKNGKHVEMTRFSLYCLPDELQKELDERNKQNKQMRSESQSGSAGRDHLAAQHKAASQKPEASQQKA